MKAYSTYTATWPVPFTLSTSAFYRLIAQGVVVDGRAGGLLFGRPKERGGVIVFRQRGDEFYLQPERLSTEDFILHPTASMRFAPRITRIMTGGRVRRPLSDDPSGFSHFICTDGAPDDKILWLTNEQVVIPEPIAERHRAELNEMNNTQNRFLFCDLEDLFDPQDLYPPGAN